MEGDDFDMNDHNQEQAIQNRMTDRTNENNLSGFKE